MKQRYQDMGKARPTVFRPAKGDKFWEETPEGAKARAIKAASTLIAKRGVERGQPFIKLGGNS